MRGFSPAQAGVTLLEMVAVVAIIGIMGAVVFPAVSSGIDAIRLASAADSVAAFLNGALNRAERRQTAVEIGVSVEENRLWLRSTESAFERRLSMPEGVRIEALLPPLAEAGQAPRSMIVIPGGTPPRMAVQIVNRRGARRVVRVDPLTGVPRIETPAGDS